MTHQTLPEDYPIENELLEGFKMAHTRTSGKKVTAIRANNGKILYALYEETCESNLHPLNPSWDCVVVGYIDSIMKRIFSYASAAEGGSLKGAGGRDITPEGYVQGWIKALANPYEQCNAVKDVYCGERFSAPIDLKFLDEAAPALIAEGFESLVERLRAGEHIELSLTDTPDAVDAIFGKGRAWQMLSGGQHAHCEVPELAYAPAPSKTFELPTAELRTFSRTTGFQDTLMQKVAGVWTHAGSAYDALVKFIRNDCAAYELSNPGTYRKRIKAYRVLLESAELVARTQFVVVIDREKITHEWKRRLLPKLCERIEHVQAGNIYRFNADQIPESESHNVEYLHDATTFEFPQAAPKAAPVVQLDLLIA